MPAPAEPKIYRPGYASISPLETKLMDFCLTNKSKEKELSKSVIGKKTITF